MRAFCHLHGFFLLYRERCYLELDAPRVTNGGLKSWCHIHRGLNGGEHKFYWRKSKELIDSAGHFEALFSTNDDHVVASDASHRAVASYTDHISSLSVPAPAFLDKGIIKTRINRISELAGGTLTIPNRTNYPACETVQQLAYARIIKYREYLNNILPKNKYWEKNSKPEWCNDFLDYQMVDKSVNVEVRG